MKILIIGGGGREHALAWKIAQSPLANRVYVAPGNAGTQLEDNICNIDIPVTDIPALLAFAIQTAIDLTIVGPETPLVAGIVDTFRAANLAIFGPTQQAAQLEGSKIFAKEFLLRHHIPTARYQSFTDLQAALAYIRQQTLPIVIKADGLAAGKGVIVATTLQEAEAAATDMLYHHNFGQAGQRIVVEEFLQGEEASFIVMVDGNHILPMATSQDHKRLGDGDTGPNTGGMGAYSPAPVVTDTVHQRIMQEIVEPTIAGMIADQMPYTGFLYVGLMIDVSGTPKVIEFNCRFGDPETQPILLRMESDFLALCLAAIEGRLDQVQAKWSSQSAVGVVMTAAGYPDTNSTDQPISGITQAEPAGIKVFHSGTRLEGSQLVTHGGRILCVTALGNTVQEAAHRAYQQIDSISWPGCYYRSDIGYRAIARERQPQ